MDPNETLKELRLEIEEPWRTGDRIKTMELFQALDQWLSKGGFLPDDWNTVCRHCPDCSLNCGLETK